MKKMFIIFVFLLMFLLSIGSSLDGMEGGEDGGSYFRVLRGQEQDDGIIYVECRFGYLDKTPNFIYGTQYFENGLIHLDVSRYYYEISYDGDSRLIERSSYGGGELRFILVNESGKTYQSRISFTISSEYISEFLIGSKSEESMKGVFFIRIGLPLYEYNEEDHSFCQSEVMLSDSIMVLMNENNLDVVGYENFGTMISVEKEDKNFGVFKNSPANSE